MSDIEHLLDTEKSVNDYIGHNPCLEFSKDEKVNISSISENLNEKTMLYGLKIFQIWQYVLT